MMVSNGESSGESEELMRSAVRAASRAEVWTAGEASRRFNDYNKYDSYWWHDEIKYSVVKLSWVDVPVLVLLGGAGRPAATEY